MFKQLLAALFVASLTLGTLGGCKGEEEQPADAIKDAAKDVSDAAKDAADDVKDAADDIAN